MKDSALLQLNNAIINQAINIYISLAYDSEDTIPHMIKNKIAAIKDAKNIEDILTLFKYEEINHLSSYKIQLGCKYYPYLKLVLEKSSLCEQYGFYVDRHSEYLATESNSPSFNEELRIKEMTKDIKAKIENQLEESNIPTIRSFIRRYNQSIVNEKSLKKKGKLILLVEDDEDINQMHSLELQLMGYEVDSVSNGYEACRSVENKYYDLMVLDLMMSGISGQEVIKRVGSEIEIVVLSALNDDFTKNTCLSLGAKEYLIKPLHKSDFEHFLESFFSNHKE